MILIHLIINCININVHQCNVFVFDVWLVNVGVWLGEAGVCSSKDEPVKVDVTNLALDEQMLIFHLIKVSVWASP